MSAHMAQDWSRSEVERAVAEYLEMLRKELANESFNKAERNRVLQEVLPERSRGSIEFKHQNISAILIELGYPYVDGYKPRSNYQDLLKDVVAERLARDPSLSSLVERVVDNDVEALPRIDDILAMQVAPPAREDQPRRAADQARAMVPTPSRINYLEQETRNRSLGLAGEELVLRFEHERLWRANQKALAERIEHVSVTRGDGLGYDIASFEESGKPRVIEVKTTRFGSMTPFFVSRNEVAVSVERDQDYFLYRVYDFRAQPKLFTLPGSIDATCDLDPIQYRASVR